MDLLNLIFGLIGVISFGFSIYVAIKERTKKEIEAAKAATQLERIRNSKHSLGGIFSSVDMIVQLPKQRSMTTEQLQDLARVARQQIVVLSKQLKMAEDQLSEWKYGEYFKSGRNSDEKSEQ